MAPLIVLVTVAVIARLRVWWASVRVATGGPRRGGDWQ